MAKYSEKVAAKHKTVPKSTDRVQRHRMNRLIKEALQIRDGEERICKAIKKNGKRCKKHAIRGGLVCMNHGGGAPQVRAAANKRLLAMVEPSLIRLADLVQQSEHMPTSLGAIRTVLERAGTVTPIGPLGKDTSEGNTRPIVQIGINLGGLVPGKLQTLAIPASNPIDVTVEEVDDDDE